MSSTETTTCEPISPAQAFSIAEEVVRKATTGTNVTINGMAPAIATLAAGILTAEAIREVADAVAELKDAARGIEATLDGATL